MKKLALLFCFSLMATSTPPTPPPATPITTDTTTAATPTPAPTNDMISYTPSATVFEDVKISQSSTLNYQYKKTELKAVSHGLRKKKVFGLIPLKIYVLEFLSAQPQMLDKDEDAILKSLKKSQAVQLKLTLSRDLPGKKITDSFKEALEVNGVDVEKPSAELAEVIDEISAIKEFKTGETFSLLALWKDKETTATLFIETPDHSVKTVTGDEKFITDLFSIWFGKPADEKLADLKKVLLK